MGCHIIKLGNVLVNLTKEKFEIGKEHDSTSLSADLLFTYDLFQGIYYAELDRKDRIEQQLSFPFGVLVIITSTTLYCIRMAIHSKSTFYALLLQIISIIVIIFIVSAAIFLLRAYHTNKCYKYSSYTDELARHIDDLKKWDSKINDECKERVEIEMKRVMVNQYVECTSVNARHNDTRSENLTRAKRSLLYAFISMLIIIYPAYRVERATSDIQKMAIISTFTKGEAHIMADENKQSKDSQPPPPPPPTRNVREANDKRNEVKTEKK